MNSTDKKVAKYIIVGLAFLAYAYFFGSRDRFSCDKWANNFKNGFECNLVLTNYSNSAGVTTLSGYDPYTKKTVEYEDGSKWISRNDYKFAVGDTILKKKAKFTIYIMHHSGQRELILCKCDKKVYRD